MQDIFASVRRSFVFRSPDSEEEGGSFSKEIGACLRRSRVGGFLNKTPPALPHKDNAPPIRWRKGELIGCGAYGRVYMGMNLDSGELLAVKQVLIPTNNASKEKAQGHIRELEEEVKLLKNLSHLNIVRYLGTAIEGDTLNILLEFVPGGSISSLLGKFGSFPEPVIRMYTKQLLQGLEYLHRNGIIHRDIKGANILVDNKGCIKLADFGASKQVVELATVSGAKSMKGTPYWMAPEVILQTGHSFSADIWSVGCTMIEMATGKPPWSQQFQEVAALFHIGTTKSHPPIPEHLSLEAKDFLLKCLQKEPNFRSTASDLLQHPFVTEEYQGPHPIFDTSALERSMGFLPKYGSYLKNSSGATASNLYHVRNTDSVRCSTIYPEGLLRMGPMWETNTSGDMCQLGDKDCFEMDGLDSSTRDDPFIRSFNPMSEPLDDDLTCKFDGSPQPGDMRLDGFGESRNGDACSSGPATVKEENEFSFPSGAINEDDDEVTESKIRAFLDEKALDLKKLQTPLYEEFYNTLNTAGSLGTWNGYDSNVAIGPKFPPKSRLSPSRVASGTTAGPVDVASSVSPGSCSRRVSNSGVNNQTLTEVSMPRMNEWMGLLGSQQAANSPGASCSERQRLWKEELDRELERQREMKRLAKASSPKDRILNRQRDRVGGFASPGK